MATIPIEVILQDAESPVDPIPTPEEETNIVVPDTGAEVVGSSNAFSSSSLSSIIPPVILLVVALATVCTLLIRRHHKHQGGKASKKEKLATSASATIAVLAAITLVSNLILPATKAATSDTTDTITPSGDKISITVTRDGGSAEASVEGTATITSTSDFGYKVLLSMAEGVETSNLYLNGDEASKHYIASTESTELGDNTWGYTLTEDGGYSAVPLVDGVAIVAQGDEAVEYAEMNIYYGVKVSSDLPAGTYSGGEIEYSLVALEPTISTLIYMQDFAKLSESGKASVLRSMTEGEQYTLKDSRDSKDYFISKLADGNVWMTQNLDLNIEAGRIYTSEDTDLAYSNIGDSWTPTASEATHATNDTTWNSSDTTPDSYDPGELYWNGVFYPTNQLDCEGYGGTWQWGTCYNANLVSSTGNDYHRLGNYYNWTAALAMSNSENYITDGASINQSICPAGWRLPKVDDQAGVGSFRYLVTQYGWNSSSNTLGGDFKMWDEPLYFPLSGSYAGSKLKSVGNGSTFWSSLAMASNRAYSLSFSSNYNVIPESSDNRGLGTSIRCLSR